MWRGRTRYRNPLYHGRATRGGRGGECPPNNFEVEEKKEKKKKKRKKKERKEKRGMKREKKEN